MTAPLNIDRFSIALDVRIRQAREDDVTVLEWWGQYFAHRRAIEATYEAHDRSEAMMLVAEVNGYPAGQAWIDLSRGNGAAAIWAVRVFPLLQGCGIGAKLMEAAERALIERGFDCAELTVEKKNAAALRFYERHGYELAGAERGCSTYCPPGGDPVTESQDQWLMR